MKTEARVEARLEARVQAHVRFWRTLATARLAVHQEALMPAFGVRADIAWIGHSQEKCRSRM